MAARRPRYGTLLAALLALLCAARGQDPRPGPPGAPLPGDADGPSNSAPSAPAPAPLPSHDAARRAHAELIEASRREQGIAGAGAGGKEREDAYVAMLAAEAARGDAAFSERPTRSFSVDAGARWNPSGMAVQRGHRYSISLARGQTWRDGAIEAGPAGYGSRYDARRACHVAAGACRRHLARAPRYRRAERLELVCGIGDYAWKLRVAAAGADRYMPLREDRILPTLFRVGDGATFTAAHTGEVLCFANDSDGGYGDNAGLVEAAIARDVWPPAPAPLRYQGGPGSAGPHAAPRA